MRGWLGEGVTRGRARATRGARGPLADYYRVPLPDRTAALADLPLLAVDVETTGLDAARDTLLSVGWVPVDGTSIVLGGAASRVLRAGREVGQSAVIHGLTDDVVAAGRPVADVLAELLAALAGRVLVAHFAHLETSFLSRACLQAYGAPLVLPVVDTMLLQRRVVAPGFDQEPRRDDLRLATARARFGLPRYAAHSAATDALACAELYLAQVAHLRLETLRQAM